MTVSQLSQEKREWLSFSLIRNEKRGFLSSLIISYQMVSYKSFMIFNLVISDDKDKGFMELSSLDFSKRKMKNFN